MKILFITATRIGDAVLSTGLLKHLADAYPDARFTIACGPVAADLFTAVPRLEELIVLRKKKYNGHWIALWKACAATRWDIVVDLRNSLVSRLLFARKKYIKKKSKTALHKVEEYAALLGLAPPPAPFLWLNRTAELRAKKLLPKDGPLLALGPTANWPPKQWPVERFAALAEKLTGPGGPLEGAKIAVFAAAHEKDQIEPLRTRFPADRLVPIVGERLLTAAACLRRASLYIGNDSGLTHIAAAAGAPTLALFGPGTEAVYGPWGPRAACLRGPVSAEELLARLPDRHAREPNLMGDLTVEAAYDAAGALWQKSAAPR